MKAFTPVQTIKNICNPKFSNLKFEIFNLKNDATATRGLKISNFKFQIGDLIGNTIVSGAKLVYKNSLI